MLVLSRQKDETIMIGDDVEITVVDIRGDKVRLGITAPTTVPVHRKEVYDAIRRENMAAAGMKPDDINQKDRSRSTPAPKSKHQNDRAGSPKQAGREGTEGRADAGTKL